ncbi:MAG: Lrp/AsnC ligand binding domain-containing protein [Actinobacteria bacterium]|nr:Lrp/AsnC ligand binding domain-containing protein [Actinomycetota bacterium]MBU4482614.1 Lrp/AsnC ligand binding domain-containing protein [Actinomycetota bacterium]MCG2791671.1 Lrp/AsnC ligand binding domain-containing protein [Actinomycetes bacterium]
MIEAYILMKSELGEQSEVYTKILKIKGVKSANTVIGPYDLIIFIESADLDTLGRTVISKIQNLKGVKDTTTCVVIEPI